MMDDVAIIRSMTSKEGSHPRATLPAAHRLPADGQRQVPDVRLACRPARLADPKCRAALVRADRRTRRQFGSGGRFPGRAITIRSDVQNAEFAADQHAAGDRLGSLSSGGWHLLDRLGGRLSRPSRRDGGRRSPEAVRKAPQMVLSPQMKAFDLSQEPAKVRDAYGRRAIRGGLPAGAAAGRGGRDVRRSDARTAGTRTTTTSTAAQALWRARSIRRSRSCFTI